MNNICLMIENRFLEEEIEGNSGSVTQPVTKFSAL